LFLGDKLNVLRTMLRDRPNDQEALQEEVELETAARRYEQFYIRLLDDRNTPLLTTPGMAEEDQTWECHVIGSSIRISCSRERLDGGETASL
jgi:hypothetical protein